MSVIAVLDACVLIPASLRDTLFRASNANLYRMRFSNEIINEVHRNLIKGNMTTEAGANRLISVISEKFRESFIEDYEQFIPLMQINEHDRHVLAAAVACQADFVVTQNLKDFPSRILKCYRIEALSPDRFLLDLFQSHPAVIAELLFEQANNLSKPSKTISDILNVLKIHAPEFAKTMEKHFESIETNTWHNIDEVNRKAIELKKDV